jgi:uncharacterized cupin superfamily protein
MWHYMAASTATYTGCIVTDWSSNTGLEYSSVGIWTPTAGELSASLAPAQTAVLLSGTVPLRYRGGHPRIYLPHVGTAAMINDHQIDPTIQTNIRGGYVLLQSHMADDIPSRSFIPCIYRYRNDPAKATVVTIGTYNVQQEVATQRRRLRKPAHR